MATLPDHGMVHGKSSLAFAETLERVEAGIAKRGIPLLAKIDHADGAAKVGLAMKPAVLLIFGNAKTGTPVMVAAPTAALDLPFKALVWEDTHGVVWISYNAPEYLQERHGFPESLVANLAGIRAIVDEAIAP